MAKWPFAAGFRPSALGFDHDTNVAAAGRLTGEHTAGFLMRVLRGWVCNEPRWQKSLFLSMSER